MECANCGRRIPEGEQTCSYCDTPVRGGNNEIQSVKPRIDGDTLRCPICSLKGISPQEEVCPQCNTVS